MLLKRLSIVLVFFIVFGFGASALAEESQQIDTLIKGLKNDSSISEKPRFPLGKITKIKEENIDKKRLGNIDNLVFHLGLIELLSYWKAFCSPEISIKCGSLDKQQIEWWKDLILNGMGEFFYQNRIDFRGSNFLKITSGLKKNNLFTGKLKSDILVPISGGKDSIVTLELLKPVKCFGLNPTSATKKIMKIAGCKKPIIVKRKIDKKLLELNRKGFLNGHTPFSAYLAFLTVFCGIIFNYKYIALSNERSSNEGNLKYLGKIINHQYSKTFDFEKKFRQYSKKYLGKDIEYFNKLIKEIKSRKIIENQIEGIKSKNYVLLRKELDTLGSILIDIEARPHIFKKQIIEDEINDLGEKWGNKINTSRKIIEKLAGYNLVEIDRNYEKKEKEKKGG